MGSLFGVGPIRNIDIDIASKELLNLFLSIPGTCFNSACKVKNDNIWTEAPDLSFRISLWFSTTTWESHGKHSTPLPLPLAYWPRPLTTTPPYIHGHTPDTWPGVPLGLVLVIGSSRL